jgi:hypothetical protein
MLLDSFFELWGFVFLAILILTLFTLIHAALQREDAYRAADKQTKGFWLIILGLAAAVQLVPLGGFGFMLLLAGLIATIVYLVDVRPALRAVTGRGGRGRGGRSSSDGPYGPYNGNR